ncbi:MAG TPA: hypothetical protein VGF34_10530 [Stellaceae bacterium]|jgi:hypothetical protein
MLDKVLAGRRSRSIEAATNETKIVETKIASLWRERRLLRDKADALNREWQKAFAALPDHIREPYAEPRAPADREYFDSCRFYAESEIAGGGVLVRNALAQHNSGAAAIPPSHGERLAAELSEDLAAAKARSAAEQERAGLNALEHEEGALNRRADAIGEQIAAMQAASIGDVLVQMELFAEGFFEEPGFDYGERALFEKIMTALRAFAGR